MNTYTTDRQDYYRRLNATLVRHTPDQRRELIARAFKTKEARQQYVYRVRARDGEEAALRLVEAIRERAR